MTGRPRRNPNLPAVVQPQDSSLAVGADVDDEVEAAGRAYYHFARLCGYDVPATVNLVRRKANVTEAVARRLVQYWTRQSEAVVNGCDEAWQLRELAEIFEASKMRSAALQVRAARLANPVVTEGSDAAVAIPTLAKKDPVTEAITESRNEDAFRSAVLPRMVVLRNKLRQERQQGQEGQRTGHLLERVLETQERIKADGEREVIRTETQREVNQ